MDAALTAESPSAIHDSTPPCMSDASMLGSSGPSLVTVDLLANRSDPPNPPDLSDRRGSRLGPTSPPHQSAEGHYNLMPSSCEGRRDSMPNHGEGDDSAAVDATDTPLPPRLDKGKGPDTVSLPPAPSQRSSSCSDEELLRDDLQAQDPTGPATEDKRSSTPLNLIKPATNEKVEEEEEISGGTTQPESQNSSYPSSLFDEAQDHEAATVASALAGEVISWKQKEKQKADPEAETGSLSEASAEEPPFRPLNVGDPGWEKSAGRPPQKLPVRFRDAVGRNFLFPWEKAKTWTGMRRLINNCFLHVDVLGPHVMAGRYDLSVSLPFSMDAANEITSPGAPLTPAPPQVSASATETPSSLTVASSSSAPGPSSSTSPSQQPQQRSSFVVLPELWEDTIEPGMLVVQHMWPFQTPNYVAQPAQPSPPQPHHHLPVGPAGPIGLPGMNPPAGRGRGARGRGRGGGTGVFGGRGGVAGNVYGPPTHPAVGSRPPMIVVSLESVHRGKTRKRQDRA
ncbi:hypothetical protein F5Y01DRAFT_290694 [Xylaria sp. FL0043]|nr:hypothetical protein F5Y01DRAFT_290694 [Xylaria sp. FL0043]